MNARKLLVATALSALSLPAAASPAVDTCRVTGNVVTSGKSQMCQLTDQVTVAIDEVTVQLTSEFTCGIEGELAKRGRVCRVDLPDGDRKDLPVEPPPPAPEPGA
ncbi:MAG: hypothetical protein H6738_04460 [Alphaproteobacteria bacterium]|nr:hypothetical protein [Alphaproteobacteria bacterium]MCB9696025.1 hypothetical protein [Alphaproteobacteria bacterium]